MSERKNILRVEHATMQFGGVVAEIGRASCRERV